VRSLVCFIGVTLVSAVVHAADPAPADLLSKSRRIVFLGDSITAAGQYVAYFDAWLVAQRTESRPEIINAGLPSETVSGLSEEGHAGGKFPRPDLAERLDRVLVHTNPDLIIACYGINCGIYEPFDEGRFARYQEGIQRLRARVEQAGARCIFMTPPFYDDQRAPKSFSYNDVLDRYSGWLVERRKEGWLVIDLHGPMTRDVRERRATQPDFTYQPDGVHPNPEGHWFIARQVIGWFGDEPAAAAATPEDMLRGRHVPVEVLPLVQERVNLLRDAYVYSAGHKRPGVAQGLPVEEAEVTAKELSAKIAELLDEER
jgi:lysophospholipase L1-like esterase